LNEIIKEIITLEELNLSVDVIRNSFCTVADEFGLTVENCPTNAAFSNESDLLTIPLFAHYFPARCRKLKKWVDNF